MSLDNTHSSGVTVILGKLKYKITHTVHAHMEDMVVQLHKSQDVANYARGSLVTLKVGRNK